MKRCSRNRGEQQVMVQVCQCVIVFNMYVPIRQLTFSAYQRSHVLVTRLLNLVSFAFGRAAFQFVNNAVAIDCVGLGLSTESRLSVWVRDICHAVLFVFFVPEGCHGDVRLSVESLRVGTCSRFLWVASPNKENGNGDDDSANHANDDENFQLWGRRTWVLKKTGIVRRKHWEKLLSLVVDDLIPSYYFSMASIHHYFARKQVGDTQKRGKPEMRSSYRNSLDLHWSASARPSRGCASVPHLRYLSVSRHFNE